MNIDEFYIDQILAIVEKHFGLHISTAQRWEVVFRLQKFIEKHNFPSFFFLYHALKKSINRSLLYELVDTIVVCESYFFRDAVLFSRIEHSILPKLNRQYEHLNMWSAACAHGQEIFSLAMICQRQKLFHKSRLFASDLSDSALAIAQKGQYHEHALKRSLSYGDIQAHFSLQENLWQLHSELRTSVIFFQHNILHPPNKTAFYSLIMLRNVLLYISPNKRRQVIEYMKSALAPGGVLIYTNPETQIYWS